MNTPDNLFDKHHTPGANGFLSVLMWVPLAIWRMNFLLWSEFRGAAPISLNQWWNGPSFYP